MSKINKENKLIIENMIRSFIEKDISVRFKEEELELIMDYLNNDISVEDRDIVDERISNDPEFKFLIDVVRFESQRNRPRSYFAYYALKIKMFFRGLKLSALPTIDQPQISTGISQTRDLPSMDMPVQIAAKPLSSYLTPVLSIGLILFVFIQLQSPTYQFEQFGYNWKPLDTKYAVRSKKDSVDLVQDHLQISHDNDTLVINWNNRNESIVANAIIIANKGYLVTGNELKIHLPLREKFLIRIYNGLTSKKQEERVWSEEDTLEITKVEYSAINEFPYHLQFDPNLTDHRSFGTPDVEKTFRFSIRR